MKTVTFWDCTCLGEGYIVGKLERLSVYVEEFGEEINVPVSQIGCASEVRGLRDEGCMVVTERWARQKGLI